MPLQGRLTRQMHPYSINHAAPDSEPDSPDTHGRYDGKRTEATGQPTRSAHTRVDPTPGEHTDHTRVDPTPGDARQDSPTTSCPANTHRRGAPTAGHTSHVSLNQSTALRALPWLNERVHPSTSVNNRGYTLIHEHYCRGYRYPILSPPLIAAGVI